MTWRRVTDSSRSPGRAELARFLRSRRERVRPEDVGLPSGSRRRTPGLRREELARLADVGVSWYTWLEQGRDIHVSEPLLERLVVALRLTPTERLHLFELAHGRPAPRAVSAPDAVSDALQRLLDAHPGFGQRRASTAPRRASRIRSAARFNGSSTLIPFRRWSPRGAGTSSRGTRRRRSSTRTCHDPLRRGATRCGRCS
nr:helix-turn-helix transcriptional regulator [Corallococcus exercitus]